jgi:hypothetical protein
LIDTPSQKLKSRLVDLEAKIAADRARLAVAETQLLEIRARNRDMLDHSVVYSALLSDWLEPNLKYPVIETATM